jgi:hypothetical protein
VRPALRALAVVSLAITTGCGADIDGICETFEDQCNDLVDADECIADGERLEEAAEDAGCEDQFDDYLSCVDDTIEYCTVELSCTAERDALTSCGVSFE